MRFVSLAASIVCGISLAWPVHAVEPSVFVHPAMAAEFSITVFPPNPSVTPEELERITNEAFAAIDDLEARISNWKDSSQISYINRHAAEGPVKAAPEVIALLQACVWASKETDGRFDITVGPLLELWGFYQKEGTQPDREAIEEARKRVGIDKVHIDPIEMTVEFEEQGMRLDMGGIGKGAAVDVAAQVLRRNGITAAMVDGGSSSMVAIGHPPGENHWTVHIRNPYNNDELLDAVPLVNASLSTAGCHDKMLEANGVRYCHILDPHSGKPVIGALSISVIAPTGTETDGLDTGFVVWPKERLEKYCREHPDIKVIYVGVPSDGAPKAERINF